MSLFILLTATAVFLLICVLGYGVLIPPRNFPKNIPTVPFYVTLLPFFKDVDQTEIYNKYFKEAFEKYGAVKIFFASQWNILVARPSYMAEVFKHEDTYQKSGNQKKIPYSVLADYTGDNIISAYGDNWKLYKSVIKPGLLNHNFDESIIKKNASLLIDLMFEEQAKSPHKSVVVPQLLQRYSLENLAECVLGSSFQVCSIPHRHPQPTSRSSHRILTLTPS